MRVKLITLGCPKNLVDSEVIAGSLRRAGAEIAAEDGEADAAIINTCGFIESAKEESIEAIWSAVELKRQGKFKRVFVTGCLTERYGAEIRAEIPGLDGVYGNRDLQDIVRRLCRELRLRTALLSERQLLTPVHYAYLKIAEGCEHPCTFCAIPSIRGGFRSRPIDQLVEEARLLAGAGVRELILIAQDSTIYHQDIDGRKRLPELLRALCRVEGVEWIRLMYAYPYHVTDELIETIGMEPKICKYLDMPIQHVSSKMLKRMARRLNRENQHRIIEKIKGAIPELALRTSVIVGFPGETEADFEELMDYVAAGYFERLGVFTYSREDGTPAARFPEQLPEAVKRERQDLLIQVQEDVVAEKNAALIGRELKVLIDEFDANVGIYKGRTQWDCPEIDNSVDISDCCEPGAFYAARVVAASGLELRAELSTPATGRVGEFSPVQLPIYVA